MYANPTYDDEYAFDNRAGFGDMFTDMLKKVAQAKTAPIAPTPAPSPGVVQVPLPPPITAPAQGPIVSQPVLPWGPAPVPPGTVSAQTTVGAPLSPTVGQQGGATPVVVTGTGDGGLMSAPAPGGIGAAVSQFVSSPTGLAVLAVVGFLALTRSRGNRRF